MTKLNLAPGKLKLKTRGGHGGHNGLKSIDAHCGKDYKRLRIGIGHPGQQGPRSTHMCWAISPNPTPNGWSRLLDAIDRSCGVDRPKATNAGFLNKIALATRRRRS